MIVLSLTFNNIFIIIILLFIILFVGQLQPVKIADVLRENNAFVYTTDQNDETTWPGIGKDLSSVTNIKYYHVYIVFVGSPEDIVCCFHPYTCIIFIIFCT